MAGAVVEYGYGVTSSESGSGEHAGDDPLAPDHFASYFRPDESDLGSVQAAEPAGEAAAESVGVVDGSPQEEPVIAEVAQPSVVDTGRLFRSQGVEADADAVLALASDHGGRLRSLQRVTTDQSSPLPSQSEPPAAAGAAVINIDTAGENPQVNYDPVHEAAETGRRRRHAGRTGLRALGVYLVVMGVTVLVAIANALLSSGSLTWITGIALVASSAYAALTVRRDDDIHAVIAPPLAFALAALTAAQVFAGPAVQSVFDRAVVWFFALADNWYWIIGATVLSLAIVIVRRYRK